MQHFYHQLLSQAKSLDKTILITDVDDPRVVEAANFITKHKICRLITVGYNEKIKNVQHISPNNYPDIEQLALDYYHMRQHKGMTIDQSKIDIQDPLIFGLMFLRLKLANGLVAGATTPTPDIIRPTLQLFKSDHKASSFFLLDLNNKVYLFTDCSLNINPTPDTLSEIIKDASDSYLQLVGATPKIALLSYSTHCSGTDHCPIKMKQTLSLVNQKYPDLIIDGDIQADAALNSTIAQIKAPQSPLNGQANILVFPDLASGNIAYKLVQQFTNCHAFGPILQGLEPGVAINDLSRGCTVEDIIGTICITAIQSSPQ